MTNTCVPDRLSHMELKWQFAKVKHKKSRLRFRVLWTFGGFHNARHRSWHGQSVWRACSRRPSGHCGLWGERWRTPPHTHIHPTPAPLGLVLSQHQTSNASWGAMKMFNLCCSLLLQIYGLALSLCFFMLWLNIVYLHNGYLRPKGSHFAHT